MSIVALESFSFEGMTATWVDYSGRIVLSIRDYHGNKATITDDHVKALLEWINSKPIPVIDYRDDEDEE